MIKCIIVDDEHFGLELMENYVKQTNFLQLVQATKNPIEAINTILTQKIDLVFLDMHMPQMTGLEVVKAIGDKCKVIMCTAHDGYAVQSYEHDVVDYLLKPIPYPRFLKSVQKAINIIETETKKIYKEPQDFLFVKTELKGKLTKITFTDLAYVESLSNYVGFWMNRKKTTVLYTLKEINQQLPTHQFIRVHNSFIVNLSFITGIQGNELILKNTDTKIPIGITYKDAVLEALKISK
jgi:two-component system, LytTR family, response regulator